MLVHSFLAVLLAITPFAASALKVPEDRVNARALTTPIATLPSKRLLRRDGSITSSSTTLPTTTIIETVTSYSTTVTETVLIPASSSTSTSSTSATTAPSSTTEGSATSSSTMTTIESSTSTSSTTSSAGPTYTSCTDIEQNYNPYPVNGKLFLVQCTQKGFDNIYNQQITDTFVDCLDLCAQDSNCAAMDYFPNGNDGTYVCEFASNNEGQGYTDTQAATWQRMSDYTTTDGYLFDTIAAQFYDYGNTPLVAPAFEPTSFQNCMDVCGETDGCYFVNYYAYSPQRQCELIPNGNYPLLNSGDYNGGAYVSGRST